MISREKDCFEGRGVWVKGRLKLFRKFICFGTLTRPWEDLVYAKNVLLLEIQSQMAWYVAIWEDSQQQKLVEI